jgi:hypothetical protein
MEKIEKNEKMEKNEIYYLHGIYYSFSTPWLQHCFWDLPALVARSMRRTTRHVNNLLIMN